MEKEDSISIINTPNREQEQFKNNVKNWVFLDNQLKVINEKTKKIREKKQEITQELCQFLTKNNYGNKKIKIQDGELKNEISMYEKKEYSSLTFTYIRDSLEKIINSEEQINYIMDFLKENREITVVSDIRKN